MTLPSSLKCFSGESTSGKRVRGSERACSEPVIGSVSKKQNVSSAISVRRLEAMDVWRVDVRKHASFLFNSVRSLYGNANQADDGAIVFSAKLQALTKRKYVADTGYSNDIWMDGYCPPLSESSSLVAELKEATENAGSHDLGR